MATSRGLVLAVLTVLAVPVLAQKSACATVTPGEAAAILGAAADKQDIGASCMYKVKGSNVSLVVRTKPTATATATKANVVKLHAILRDEAGLGAGAYSATLTDSARRYSAR